MFAKYNNSNKRILLWGCLAAERIVSMLRAKRLILQHIQKVPVTIAGLLGQFILFALGGKIPHF